MENKKREKNTNEKSLNIYTIYTIYFLIVSFMVFSFFVIYGKSLVWNNDGLNQHYNAFAYFGTWIRSIIKNLIHGNGFVVPMWEHGIGYGADIITTLGYYQVGDPFALISVFMPVSYAEAGYAISIILRIYMVGVMFLVYSRKMRCNTTYSIYGAVLYAFCAYTIVASVRHPFFINAMIWLPLILAGVEDILENKKPFRYIFSIFIASVSNFYFFYILVLITVVYTCIRVFSNREYRKIRTICVLFIKFICFSLIGVMLASFLFIPNAMNFLGDMRVSDVYRFNPICYIGQYEMLFGTLIGTESIANWMYVGVAPVAYIGVFAMLYNKKEQLWTKIQLAVFIVFMCLPLFGHIFNGFGYVCNRWVFAWSFFVAFSFEKGFPYLLQADSSIKKKTCITCTLYSIICMLLSKSRTEESMTLCVLLLITVVFVLMHDDIKDIKIYGKTITQDKLTKLIMYVLVTAGIFIMAFYKYSPTEKNYIKEFITSGRVYDTLVNDRMAAVKSIDDKDFYRIDDVKINKTQKNYYINSGKSNTSFYWSLINPYIVEYMRANGAYDSTINHLNGLDSRAMLSYMAGARYIIVGQSEAEKKAVPYGYEYTSSCEGENGSYDLYKTSYALPLGYSYENVITESEFYKLSVARRQQAMLQSAVVADMNENDITKLNSNYDAQYGDTKLSYEVVPDGNVEINGNSFVVKEKNATVTLSLDCPAASELYVEFDGFEFNSMSPLDLMTENEYNALSVYDRKVAQYSQKYWRPITNTTITVTSGNTWNSFVHYTPYDAYAEGRDNYFLNLYYDENERKSVKIKFSEAGTYKFDELNVISQSMEDMQAWTESLKRDKMENIKLTDNTITGTVRLDETKLMCISIPYSSGWSCYVDGNKQTIYRVNVMYQGIILTEGEHSIEMKYETPYLREGIYMTCIGLLIIVILLFIYRKKINVQ